MKIIHHHRLDGDEKVRVDSPVTVREFTEYIASLYSQAIGASDITSADITSADITDLLRTKLGKDEADFAIYNGGKMELWVMGFYTPSDTHTIIKYHGSSDNFERLASKLEEVCWS